MPVQQTPISGEIISRYFKGKIPRAVDEGETAPCKCSNCDACVLPPRHQIHRRSNGAHPVHGRISLYSRCTLTWSTFYNEPTTRHDSWWPGEGETVSRCKGEQYRLINENNGEARQSEKRPTHGFTVRRWRYPHAIGADNTTSGEASVAMCSRDMPISEKEVIRTAGRKCRALNTEDRDTRNTRTFTYCNI
ncbi:hypothetical protein J6590_025522 [Homalodisca vitripennis]|nr:hypothetical protein J6590_025522 [Homalodisca vitripennis]